MRLTICLFLCFGLSKLHGQYSRKDLENQDKLRRIVYVLKCSHAAEPPSVSVCYKLKGNQDIIGSLHSVYDTHGNLYKVQQLSMYIEGQPMTFDLRIVAVDQSQDIVKFRPLANQSAAFAKYTSNKEGFSLGPSLQHRGDSLWNAPKAKFKILVANDPIKSGIKTYDIKPANEGTIRKSQFNFINILAESEQKEFICSFGSGIFKIDFSTWQESPGIGYGRSGSPIIYTRDSSDLNKEVYYLLGTYTGRIELRTHTLSNSISTFEYFSTILEDISWKRVDDKFLLPKKNPCSYSKKYHVGILNSTTTSEMISLEHLFEPLYRLSPKKGIREAEEFKEDLPKFIRWIKRLFKTESKQKANRLEKDKPNYDAILQFSKVKLEKELQAASDDTLVFLLSCAYLLKDFYAPEDEKKELIKMCLEKINSFIVPMPKSIRVPQIDMRMIEPLFDGYSISFLDIKFITTLYYKLDEIKAFCVQMSGKQLSLEDFDKTSLPLQLKKYHEAFTSQITQIDTSYADEESKLVKRLSCLNIWCIRLSQPDSLYKNYSDRLEEASDSICALIYNHYRNQILSYGKDSLLVERAEATYLSKLMRDNCLDCQNFYKKRSKFDEQDESNILYPYGAQIDKLVSDAFRSHLSGIKASARQCNEIQNPVDSSLVSYKFYLGYHVLKNGYDFWGLYSLKDKEAAMSEEENKIFIPRLKKFIDTLLSYENIGKLYKLTITFLGTADGKRYEDFQYEHCCGRDEDSEFNDTLKVLTFKNSSRRLKNLKKNILPYTKNDITVVPVSQMKPNHKLAYLRARCLECGLIKLELDSTQVQINLVTALINLEGGKFRRKEILIEYIDENKKASCPENIKSEIPAFYLTCNEIQKVFKDIKIICKL